MWWLELEVGVTYQVASGWEEYSAVDGVARQEGIRFLRQIYFNNCLPWAAASL